MGKKMRMLTTADPQGQRYAYVKLTHAMYYLESQEGNGDSWQLIVNIRILVKFGKVELEVFSWDE